MTEQSPSTLLQPRIEMQPTPVHERIEVLDIIRGFALFGILLVNMAFYSSPIYLYVTNLHWWTGTADQIAQWLIRFLAENKFYSLFSFLFGLGLELQMSRTEARGAGFVPLYVRRMLILFVIGLLHGALLWAGDILVPYAVMGFLLLLFRHRQPKTILKWAVVCLLIPVLIMGLAFAALELGRMVPQAAEEINAQFARNAAEYESLIHQSFKVYAAGTFSEVMGQRLRDLGFSYAEFFFLAPNVFALFLLGLYAGKQKIFHNIPSHLPFIRRVFWRGLGLGVFGNLVFAILRAEANPAEPTLPGFLYTTALAFGAPALCFFYVASIIRLAQHKVWCKYVSYLAAVGRTAISNYLFQSLVCTTIFLSYGFGLYGKVGPAAGLALTIVIFVVQVVLSQWWLKRFQFGPVEWLWRSLTYGRVQPMRSVQAAAAHSGSDDTHIG
jgi:uncharacterized protein